jgi:chaperonin GroES
MKKQTKQIYPLGERVLIKPIKEEEKNLHGLIMPGKEETNIKKGVVLDVNSENKKAIVMGSHVMYFSQGSIDVGDDMFLVDEKNLLAVIEK